MTVVETNAILFSEYSGNVQEAFIRSLMDQYRARNLAYLRSAIEANYSKELLEKYGMAAAIDSLIADYERIAREVIAGMPGVTFAAVPSIFISVLKEMETQFWYEHVRDVGMAAKRNLILASISGIREQELIDNLRKATRELSTAQVNALSNTQLRTFSNAVFWEGAEILPEDATYWYVGPVDNKNRPACAQVLSDPRASGEGFTRAEIMGLPVDEISRGGFNCRHDWELAVA